MTNELGHTVTFGSEILSVGCRFCGDQKASTQYYAHLVQSSKSGKKPHLVLMCASCSNTQSFTLDAESAIFGGLFRPQMPGFPNSGTEDRNG